jgi:hypothetical protein
MVFPLMLKYLLEWVKEDDPSTQQGVMLASIVSFGIILKAYFNLTSSKWNHDLVSRLKNCIKVP